MTRYYMRTSTCVDKLRARVWSESATTAILYFGERTSETAFHLPRHVAEATVEAFNRAMQVECKDGGMIYTNDAGLWHISTSHVTRPHWHAQHDEITGDGDPAWMTADAPSLEELQDALDDIAAERKEDAA